MAHRRPPLVRALQLNTAVLVVEIAAGVGSNSFSLIMDGIHNLSDEVALMFLVLAYSLRAGLSGKLLRYANLFNSVGLLAISVFLIMRVVERLSHPVEVFGAVPIAAGLIGAAANWGVARVLREPSKEDVAIRLAYVHNLGDTLVSLIPVAAGVLIFTSGSSIFDSLFALLLAAVIVITTLQAVVGSHKELLWPENVSCGHSAAEQR
ncbi:MAG TPA: cation transporter [Candidatus Binatia bacterium]|jgi:cobalt-zinc-cadmium efflux system protein